MSEIPTVTTPTPIAPVIESVANAVEVATSKPVNWGKFIAIGAIIVVGVMLYVRYTKSQRIPK